MTEQEYQELMAHSPGAFRLNRPPLYVFKLLRTERALYLFMDVHHLIFDGFSVNLFLQDLAAELRAESCTTEKISYARFALQQQEFLAGEEAKEFDAYFGALFADYDSPSRLTTDMPMSENPGKAARVQTEISQELVDKAVQRTGVDGENGPVIEVVYDDALYSAELAANIGWYCRTVIRRFAENGAERLRSISLLDEEEQLLLDCFHTVPEEAAVSLDTFFFSDMEKFAAAYPERTALIAVDGTFRYGEFDRITDRVANALIKRGAKVGDRVLILLPRTFRALFAFYGASKAGLGYIPFDPAYPTERVNMVIEDSQAKFVITTTDMLSRFADKCALDIEELLQEKDDTKPHVALSQQDISYFIYTSGSTGRPKGVMLTHGGIAHYVADMPHKEMVNALRSYCSVYACITTLSFDMSVMGYALALANGK